MLSTVSFADTNKKRLALHGLPLFIMIDILYTQAIYIIGGKHQRARNWENLGENIRGKFLKTWHFYDLAL